METADLAASNAVIILVMESWAEVGCVPIGKVNNFLPVLADILYGKGWFDW